MNGIIIGGGIGGFATALALEQRGITCSIYEQAPEIREVGAGLVLSPNAMQVLNWLGLSHEVLQVGWNITKGNLTNAVGNLAQFIDVHAFSRKYGYGMVVVHRGKLQQLLANQLKYSPVFTGKKLTKLTQLNDRVQVLFGDGTTAEADFVIGADGIRSTTRRLVFGEKTLRYSGQTCWRSIVDYTLPVDLQRTSMEYWGDEPGLRFGLVPIGPNQVYFWTTALAAAGGRDVPGQVKGYIQQLSKSFAPEVQVIVNSLDESRVHRSDLFDLPTLTNWSANRVTLLGDAAHATTPNLGQGACQAIEDAYAIASCLSQDVSIPQALRHYQQLRKPKADRVVRISRQLGQAANMPAWLKPLVFGLMKKVPAFVSEKQFDQIFNMDYLQRFQTKTSLNDLSITTAKAVD